MSGNFSVGHFVDPLGLTSIGKGKGGGAKNAWDPAGLFTSGDKPAAATPADTTPAATPPVAPLSQTVVGAMQGQVQSQLRRKSINSTIYAGATGGWMPGSPTSTSAPTVSNGASKTG